jgi:hypothetical protein
LSSSEVMHDEDGCSESTDVSEESREEIWLREAFARTRRTLRLGESSLDRLMVVEAKSEGEERARENLCNEAKISARVVARGDDSLTHYVSKSK